jgi:hypothetical protein
MVPIEKTTRLVMSKVNFQLLPDRALYLGQAFSRKKDLLSDLQSDLHYNLLYYLRNNTKKDVQVSYDRADNFPNKFMIYS